MIYGVDVSSWQDEQFPLTVNDKPVDFAIIKATQGLGYVNPRWREQAEWARKNGLSVGFYHFVDAGSITKQADFFLTTLGALRPGDHLWFDWESADVTDVQKDEWIRYVQAARPGHKVGLYCNRHFWLNRDLTEFAGDALWIADWTGFGNPPGIQAAWRVHQYSTADSLDRNVADFPDRAAMKAWAGLVEPVGGNLDEVLAKLEGLHEYVTGVIRESLVQLGRQVATIQEDLEARSEDTAAVRAAQVQLAKNVAALPKKVADEINKRLAQ